MRMSDVHQCRSNTYSTQGLGKNEVADVCCGFAEVSSAGLASTSWLWLLAVLMTCLEPHPALPYSDKVTV